jgi:uncharacterized membrane protein
LIEEECQGQFRRFHLNTGVVGIRLPWTLKSEHVWRQTHRVAGWVWTSSSLIMAALAWLLPVHLLEPQVGGVWLLLLIGVPLVVAWREARLEKQRLASASGAH